MRLHVELIERYNNQWGTGRGLERAEKKLTYAMALESLPIRQWCSYLHLVQRQRLQQQQTHTKDIYIYTYIYTEIASKINTTVQQQWTRLGWYTWLGYSVWRLSFSTGLRYRATQLRYSAYWLGYSATKLLRWYTWLWILSTWPLYFTLLISTRIPSCSNPLALIHWARLIRWSNPLG